MEKHGFAVIGIQGVGSTHIRTSPEAWGKLDASWEPVEVPSQEGPTGHAGIAADMIAAIEQNRAPVAAGEEGIASVELANAMILSSKRGKTVDLPVDKDEYDALLADLRGGRVR